MTLRRCNLTDVLPPVLGERLEDGYRAMAADVERERDASEWINGLAADMSELAAVEDAVALRLGLKR